MEATGSSETFVNNYKSTRSRNSQEHNLHVGLIRLFSSVPSNMVLWRQPSGKTNTPKDQCIMRVTPCSTVKKLPVDMVLYPRRLESSSVRCENLKSRINTSVSQENPLIYFHFQEFFRAMKLVSPVGNSM